MRFLTLIILSLFSSLLFSQEQLGLRTDNYSGIHGTLMNPSHNITSLFSWDVNLVSGGFFGATNYGYIEETNISRSARNVDDFILRRDIESPSDVGPNTLVGDFYDSNRKKYLTLFANGMGPSFMVKLRNGHSFGMFLNGRTAFSTHSIPAAVNYNVFFETPFFEFIDVEDFKISAMAWGELGFNYAAKIDTYDGYMGLGINLKFINAFEAAYLHSKRTTSSAQVPGDTLLFQSPHLNYGITNSNLEGEAPSPSSNGFGVGVDLGFTYVYEGDEDHYKWKIGASLLDLGQIELSQNAEAHNIVTDSLVVFPQLDFNAITNRERINLLSQIGLGDPDASFSSQSFRIGLPGALSVQGDYMFTPNVYIHGVLIQRIPMGPNSLLRNNLLAVTPRFEHRWFGAALPVVLLNYQKLSMGTSIRLAFLTIGSDDIGSFVRKGNLDSTDFYFALKINPFNLGLNLGRGGGRRAGKRVKCYEF